MLRQGEGNKNFQTKKDKIVDNDVEIQLSQGEDTKYDTSKIKELKESMKKTAVEMLKNLDLKHDSLKSISYYPCYDRKCSSLYSSLKGYEISQNGNKEKLFLPNESLPQAQAYNHCVQDCQEPLRSSRFMVEFQLKEWQVSLNECFHYCKYDNSQPVECIQYCCKEYSSMLNEVRERLYNEYDVKIQKFQE